MKTKELRNVRFQVSSMIYDVDLPAGLRVKAIDREPGYYFLDEFPAAIFPKDGFMYHDAIHYGIRLHESQVED